MGHQKLFHTYDNYILQRREEYILKSTYDPEKDQSVVRSEMISSGKRIACYYYSDNNNKKAKEYFYLSALHADYAYEAYRNTWTEYNFKPYVCAILSDSESLIKRFANLKLNHIEWQGNGNSATFNLAIQGLLRSDEDMIFQSLQKYKDSYAKGEQKLWMKNHILAIESMMQKDKSGLEQAILGYEHKTIQKEMIKADICEEVISFWGTLWAKLGWMKGIYPMADTKRVPIELLESKPLKEYTIPYWFLRDFYRAQGVDWRYDPVYPELQDWENDPENPNRKKGGFFGKFFNF